MTKEETIQYLDEQFNNSQCEDCRKVPGLCDRCGEQYLDRVMREYKEMNSWKARFQGWLADWHQRWHSTADDDFYIFVGKFVVGSFTLLTIVPMVLLGAAMVVALAALFWSWLWT